MYFRKMRPRTTCLYSAASMLLRSLSAASQSLASKPMLAPDSVLLLVEPERAMKRQTYQTLTSLWRSFCREEGKRNELGAWSEEHRAKSSPLRIRPLADQRSECDQGCSLIGFIIVKRLGLRYAASFDS